ncbi:MAG: MATE family efflux transporter [Oscillospiraceae bacterium]|nr:MATE family efflux transporter [Oscillospiraceae bacterium]
MNENQNFTTGPIYAPLIRFCLPVLLALFLQAMYSAVDLMIVGRFGGELADVYVSAVSTGSQIMISLTFVVTGLAMGLTVLVGEKIGAGRREEAGRIIGSGICLFAVVAVVLTLLMLIFAEGLSSLMHAPKEAFGSTVAYVAICGGGMAFITAYNLLGSIFRGIGDSKTPLLTVFIACVTNILCDLLLVAVLGMGAAGAAIATVFAQGVSVVLSLLIVRKRALPFAFSRRDIRFHGGYIKKILRLGVPIALQDILVSISFLVLLAIINDIGLTESAGLGVAERVCAFIMLIPSAFMQAMSAFVAQNMGAGRLDRARRALLYGIVTSLAVGIAVGGFTFFRGDLLAAIFAKDAHIIAPAADYLKAYAIDCMLTPFLFCFMGYFNGCGNTTFVMAQGIIGAIGVRLPVSWYMSGLLPVSLFRIGLATPCSTVVQIALCLGFFVYTARRIKR